MDFTVGVNLAIVLLVGMIAAWQLYLFRTERPAMKAVIGCEEKLIRVEAELEEARRKLREVQERDRDKTDIMRVQTGTLLVLMDKLGIPTSSVAPASVEMSVKRNKRVTLVGVWADVSNLAALNLRRDLEMVLNSGNFVYRPLVGKVTGSDLEQEFLAGGQADILYIASHADPEGIYFSDQKYSPSWIGEIAAQHGVSLVVLNACKTRQVAINVVAKGVKAVVYSLRDIPDTTAIGFAKAFFLALALGRPSNEAVESAQRAITEFDKETPRTAFGSFGSWSVTSDPFE